MNTYKIEFIGLVNGKVVIRQITVDTKANNYNGICDIALTMIQNKDVDFYGSNFNFDNIEYRIFKLV